MSSTKPDRYFASASDEYLLDYLQTFTILRNDAYVRNHTAHEQNHARRINRVKTELLRRMALASPDPAPPHDAPPAPPAQQGEPGSGGDPAHAQPGPGSPTPEQRRLMQDAIRRLPSLWTRVFG